MIELSDEEWPGEVVEDLEPYEKWDLIAWPKLGYTGDSWDRFFDAMDAPRIDGQPMKLGYVVKVEGRYVYVREAEPSRFGQERIKSLCAEPSVPTTVPKEKIVAKKQREYNERYQVEKQKRERRERRRRARFDWLDLPAWKRWAFFLTRSKGEWIERRVEKLKEDQKNE